MSQFLHDMFLCYRNPPKQKDLSRLFDIKSANSEAVAKKCKEIIERINLEMEENVRLSCYFSQDKYVSNYEAESSLNKLVGQARFFVMFVFPGFTTGFLMKMVH